MKRVVDIFVSFVFLVLLSPLMLLVAVLVRVRLGSPVLFRQARPGLKGKTFYLLKFRTMTNEVDSSGTLLPDERRLPKFGKFLRAASIDELPSLWNVIRGDMSLIGPRPLLPEYLELYSAEQSRRHDVRPGITGLAQVSGRNDLPWDKRLELDVWYVDHQTAWLDLKICVKSVWKVLSSEGVSQAGHVTAEKFRGSSR
jgi:sugar transferase EpsL